MRRALLFALFCLSLGLFSQAPQKINYQGVARNSSGTALAGVTLTVSIDISGVFSETHVVTSNTVGIFSLQIGGGTTLSGSFSSINWAGGSNNISVTIDSGSGPQSLGTQQLVSVPYALYAEKAGSPNLSYSGGVLTVGTNTVPLSAGVTYVAGTDIQISGNVITNTAPDQTVTLTPGTNVNISGAYPNFNISSTPTLSIAGTQLSISGGNTVILPSAGTVVATPNTSLTGTGIANITSSGTNTFNVNVPNPVLSVTGNTISITQGTATTTQTISIGVTPTITGTGIATVSPLSGNNFTVNVPPVNLNFNNSTGILSYSPAIGTNTLLIPGTGLWSSSSATAVVVTNTNNYVGIGSLNPMENLQIESTANTRLSLISTSTNTSAILFGTPVSHNQGHIVYDNSINTLSFGTGGFANRIFIDGAGRVAIGGHNLSTTPANVDLHVARIGPNTGKLLISGGDNSNNYGGILSFAENLNLVGGMSLKLDAIWNRLLITNDLAGTSPIVSISGYGGVNGMNIGATYAGVANNPPPNGLAVEGNIGLGTLSPAQKLDVIGSVKITDGTQADGKIFGSDAVGKGTWKNSPPATAYGNLNNTSTNVSTVFVPLGIGSITFNKVYPNTEVEIFLHTLVYTGAYAGVSWMLYELRVDGIPSPVANTHASFTGAVNDFLTIKAIFQGLPPGIHTITLMAKTNAGTSTGVIVDMGGFGGKIIVKETF